MCVSVRAAHEHTSQQNEKKRREWAIGLHLEIILYANKTDRTIIFDETNVHTYIPNYSTAKGKRAKMSMRAYRK